jgi:hypothetical protein
MLDALTACGQGQPRASKQGSPRAR